MLILPLAPVLLLIERISRLHLQPFLVFAFVSEFLVGGLFWIGLGIYHPPVITPWVAVTFGTLLLILHGAAYGVVFWVLRLIATKWVRARGTAALAVCMALTWRLTEILRSIGIWAMPWGCSVTASWTTRSSGACTHFVIHNSRQNTREENLKDRDGLGRH